VGEKVSAVWNDFEEAASRRRHSQVWVWVDLEMKYVRTFFVIAGFLILCLGVEHGVFSMKAQEPMKLHSVEVGMNSVLPPGQVVGFACGAGLADPQVRCFALVKE